MTLKFLHVAAILLVALCFVPTGAHLFALPNKMAMDQAAYFTAQQIYNGWALFGIAQAAALFCCIWLAWAARETPMAMGFAAAGAGLIVASLAAFFTLTYPAMLRPRIGRASPRTGRRCGSTGRSGTPQEQS